MVAEAGEDGRLEPPQPMRLTGCLRSLPLSTLQRRLLAARHVMTHELAGPAHTFVGGDVLGEVKRSVHRLVDANEIQQIQSSEANPPLPVTLLRGADTKYPRPVTLAIDIASI